MIRRGIEGQIIMRKTWKQRMKSILFGMLLGIIIPSLALGQATLLPDAKQQYLTDAADPVANGTVTYYIPSTSTKKNVWLDAAKTTLSTNPVLLDAAGRPQPTGQTYGDGTYRQVVKDVNNVTIWDAVTTSTGSSSSGGGSIGTGDGDLVGTIKPWAGLAAPSQYLFAYGQAISRTTYAALFTAITQSQSVICTSGLNVLSGLSDTTQIPIGGKVEATCIAPGATVTAKSSTSVTISVNAAVSTAVTAKFFLYGNGDGATTFNVPDLRGRVLPGRDNMGGTAAGTLTSTYFGTNPDATGATGGNQSKTFAASDLPTLTTTNPSVTAVSVTTTDTSIINAPGAADNFTSIGGFSLWQGQTRSARVSTGNLTINSVNTISNSGGIAVSSVIAAAGSGYTNGSQTITVSGGTCTTQPQFTVTVAGNVFTGTPALLTAGSCTVAPANPVATTGGGGTGGTLNVSYSAQPISLIQPSITMNYIIKVTPDTNSATASGVTSLGTMTGDIACGTGLLCTGNVVSVVAPTVTTDSVFYTPPYTGGTVETQTAYNSQRVSVKDFGAIGNGTADDTTAVQAAITAGQTALGKEVYFPAPASCYKITSTLSITAPVSLKGEGGLASKICAVNTNAITVNFVTGFGNVTIDGLYLLGSGATGVRYGIYGPGTTDSADVIYGVTISNTLISTFPVGISFRTVRNISINNSWIQNVDKGIQFVGAAFNVNIGTTKVVKAAGGGGFVGLAGLELDSFAYSVGGTVAPESVSVSTGSKFFGFDTCILLTAAIYVTIDQTDIGGCANVGIQFATVQNGLQITNSYVEIVGAAVTQGIYGIGLGSAVAAQINIADNSIIASGTVAASGVQINGPANQNQNNVNIVRNYFSGLTTNDIRLNNPGPGNVENNRCASSGVPTNSISVGTRVSGVITVSKNVCVKDIVAVTAGDLTSGFIRLENNIVNATTAQASNWNVTTDNTTANRLMLGGGTGVQPSALAAGTTTMLLHGNAGGAPSFGQVVAGDIATGAVSAKSNLVLSNSAQTLAAGATAYITASIGCATEANCYFPVSAPMTLSNMYVSVGAAPGGVETFIFTLMSGNRGATSASTVTCTITGAANFCSDTVHSVSVTAGQVIDLRAVASGAAATTSGITANFTATIASP